jgi:hypothetical protein
MIKKTFTQCILIIVHCKYLYLKTNYEKKTDKLNFNSTIKFSNDLLNDKQPNQTKEND